MTCSFCAPGNKNRSLKFSTYVLLTEFKKHGGRAYRLLRHLNTVFGIWFRWIFLVFVEELNCLNHRHCYCTVCEISIGSACCIALIIKKEMQEGHSVLG